MLRACLAAAALVALTSCEAITGISDKTLIDAGTTPLDAANGDGGGKAGVPCSRQPTNLFCDDFDSDGKQFMPPWDWNTTALGATSAFDPAEHATAPYSARFTAPSPSSAMASSSAQIGKQVGSGPSAYHLSFDLRLDETSLGTVPETSVAQVLEGSGLSINYVVRQGSCALVIFGGGGSGPTLVDHAVTCPPLRSWTTIVLGRDAQSISVTEDGQPLVSVPPPAAGAIGGLKFILGAVYANQTAGASMITFELDDVVVFGS